MGAVKWSVVVGLALSCSAGWGQDAGQSQAAGDALTGVEQQQVQQAGQAFAAGKYADALVAYKALHAAHPGNAQIAKFAAEAAINVGEAQYALGILQPMAAANPDDWQATGLLARIYAQTGDEKNRDAEMAHMAELYQKGLIPARLQQYLLERVVASGKTIMIWHSLVPWGNYKVYDYARVFDGNGQLLMRITLESADMDQALFAKLHPEDAAAGKRQFSLDGYKDLGATPDGGHREMHLTYGFLVGEPAYDEVRADFVKIATGTWTPMSSNTHPAAQ